MRIIAGRAKGSQIFTPKSRDTRPTQDRVRESLFNILQGDVPGATVLDLFAGSGALALESISRGADKAVTVDHSHDADACIRRNAAKLGFADQIEVLKCDWRASVSVLQRRKMQFDLVFLDPPYNMTETPEICECLEAAGLLFGEALIVIEHGKGCEPVMNSPFIKQDMRTYGDTEISFFTYRP